MIVDGPESMGLTKERWAVLEDLLNVLVMKEKTPAKVMVALDKMTDILPIEKLLMVYAMGWSLRQKVTKLTQAPEKFLPVVSMS